MLHARSLLVPTMLKKSLLFALLASATAVRADVLYNNTNPADVGNAFTTAYGHVADDFQFGGQSSSYNPAVTISQLELGYDNISNAPASFDMAVNFYQDMDITSSTGTASIFSGYEKSYLFHFVNEPTGDSTTQLINLADFGGVVNLPAVSDFSRDNHGIEVLFYNTGTTTLSTKVKPLFLGDNDPSVGYSYDTYARSNSTAALTPANRNDFGGSPFMANFYMQLTGSVQAVPEPSSVAALAVGALALLRRRKRA